MDTGKSALGLDGNVAAALGYPIGIIAIISLIMEKENRFVKFHALQSILLHVGAVVLMIALWVISAVVFVGGIAASAATNTGAIGGLASMLLGLVWFVFVIIYLLGLIFAAVKAYQGADFKLPIIGNMAEKWTK
ncbi:MAG TPA: hypothetical protein VIU65_00370 [Pyrinomonadaceae bacterium]